MKNNNSWRLRKFLNEQRNNTSRFNRSIIFLEKLHLIVTLALVAVSIRQCNQIDFQNKLFEKQNHHIEIQNNLLESERRSSLVFLLNTLLDKIDDELKNSKDRSLTRQTMARIISLSHNLTPYRSYTDNGLSVKKLSKERALLLSSLVHSNINEQSLGFVAYRANFQHSDLRNFVTSYSNMKFFDLSHSDLTDAKFTYSDLSHTKLNGASLDRSIFNHCNMSQVSFEKAHLGSTALTCCNLFFTNFRNSIISNNLWLGSKFRFATFENVDIDSVCILEDQVLNYNHEFINMDHFVRDTGILLKPLRGISGNVTIPPDSVIDANLHEMIFDSSFIDRLLQDAVIGNYIDQNCKIHQSRSLTVNKLYNQGS